MNWEIIESERTLEEIYNLSTESPVLIFKHSHRCGSSLMIKDRLSKQWRDDEMSDIKTYMINVINNRDLSQRIMEMYGVIHQSPQVLAIYKGACIYSDSHMGINYTDIRDQLIKLTA